MGCTPVWHMSSLENRGQIVFVHLSQSSAKMLKRVGLTAERRDGPYVNGLSGYWAGPIRNLPKYGGSEPSLHNGSYDRFRCFHDMPWKSEFGSMEAFALSSHAQLEATGGCHRLAGGLGDRFLVGGPVKIPQNRAEYLDQPLTPQPAQPLVHAFPFPQQTAENQFGTTHCLCCQNPSLLNQCSTTLRIQLNWTGHIANSSNSGLVAAWLPRCSLVWVKGKSDSCTETRAVWGEQGSEWSEGSTIKCREREKTHNH